MKIHQAVVFSEVWVQAQGHLADLPNQEQELLSCRTGVMAKNKENGAWDAGTDGGHHTSLHY